MRRLQIGDNDWHDKEIIEFWDDEGYVYICEWEEYRKGWQGLEYISKEFGPVGDYDGYPYSSDAFVGYHYISHGVKCVD
jgi:hypothetical protein